MNNREKLNSMSDKELSHEVLCYIVELVAGALDHDNACKYCPVTKICRKGKNGFISWLEQDTEDFKDAKEI